jgi:hypothetical protein
MERGMTTSSSSLRVLTAQSNKIAATLKAAERGEGNADVMVKARATGKAVIAIVMDDKLVTLTIPLATIKNSSEVALAAYVLKHMKEQRDDA